MCVYVINHNGSSDNLPFYPADLDQVKTVFGTIAPVVQTAIALI